MIDAKKLKEWREAARDGMNYDNCNDDDIDKLCEAVPALIAEVERLTKEREYLGNTLLKVARLLDDSLNRVAELEAAK